MNAGPTMLGRLAFSGRTSWMNWLRRPRLNRAVHSVAVLMPARRARVSGFIWDTMTPGVDRR
ncbi:hypothetical protein D3C78_1759350 [compost metagenome]